MITLPKTIVVPARLREIDLHCAPLPVRLKTALSQTEFHGLGIRRLGDLHGLTYEVVARQRNCGLKSVAVLHDFLQNAKTGDFSVVPYYFSVPDKFRDLLLADLPFTVRAWNVFRQLNVVRLGDFNGKPCDQLEEARNCGRKTVQELRQMIDRAVAGEFLPPDADGWTPEMIIPLLDALLEQLPESNRSVICLKLGADDGRPASLSTVRQRVGLSPARVVQILKQVGRLPVLPLKAHLEALMNYCRHNGDVVSPEQLSQWVGATPQRYSLSFYVRFISRLNPDIPVEGV